jgi:hypothetical protein
LIAFTGAINAGDAGVRVSGNINLAAVQVLNAGNIQVGGTSTGVPTVQAPPVAALTSASNTAGATQQTALPARTGDKDRPSVIIVEFLGFGGGDGTHESEPPKGDSSPKNQGQQNGDAAPVYNPNGPVRILGVGILTDEQKKSLSEAERGRL